MVSCSISSVFRKSTTRTDKNLYPFKKEAVKTHKKYFEGEDDDDDADDSSMGSAAAMQALKMFTGGQSGNTAVCHHPHLLSM